MAMLRSSRLASKTWFFSRMSRQAKVRLIRSLDLPESVLLDFLSVELQRLIGARNGPRDRNDVRVRAAKLLLSYELPAPDSAPAPRRILASAMPRRNRDSPQRQAPGHSCQSAIRSAPTHCSICAG